MYGRRASVFAALGLVAGLLAACGGSDETKPDPETNKQGDLVVGGEVVAGAELYDKARDEGSFMLYTGGGEESERELLDKFEEDTGIEGELLRLVPNKLTERILSEQAADELGADAIRISDANLVKSVAESGAFQKHSLPKSFPIPKDAIREGGAYFRTFDRIYAIGYNHQAVSDADAPTSWKDLTDSGWEEKIGIVQVGAGGSTASLTRFQFSKFGADYLKTYAGLKPRIFDSASTAIDAVARGEIEVSPVTVGNAAGSIAEGAPIRLVFPEEGMPAYEYFLGLAAGAEHSAAARVFLNWSMTQRGQQEVARQGDYPTRTDTEAPSIGDIEMPAREEAGLVRYEYEEALKRTKPDAAQWSDIFGYNSTES